MRSLLLASLLLACGSSARVTTVDGSSAQDRGFSAGEDFGIRSPDLGPRECRSAADCPSGDTCYFYEAGCAALGRCERAMSCRPDAVLEYFCGCDGLTTSMTCHQMPWMARGPCHADAGVDAGSAD